MTTAITTLTTEQICVNPSDSKAIQVSGSLYEAMVPGAVVQYDATNNYWIKADASTLLTGLIGTIGVVGYRKRINQSTGATIAITDTWATTEIVPIWISGFVFAAITDPSATLHGGANLAFGATAGSLTKQAITTGYLTKESVATIAYKAISGDTWALIGIGQCKGLLYAL